MSELARVGLGEFATDVALSAGQPQWHALVVADSRRIPHIAELLCEELRIVLDDADEKRIVVLDQPARLPCLLAKGGAEVVIVTGLEGLGRNEWADLNFLRSRLFGDWSIVWVLSTAALSHMESWAKDLDTILRASTRALDPMADRLSQAERDSRLGVLREKAGMSDADLVARAERGDLPPDPEYAEWLTLLGKGNLLAPR